jgi:hypothetical protein
MVLLRCSHVGGTKDLTWMININGILYLMKGFIVYIA